MNHRAPFQPEDLAELDKQLFDRALAVVPMQDIHDGQRHPEIIGLRHDVDNAIEPAVKFARWEADRGYRSTYFILHTAPYWNDKRLLVASLEAIAEDGHEIGIHNNSLAAALVTGIDPRQILAQAVSELRGYGFAVRGTVAHGDSLCYDTDGQVRFVNDELFAECPRPSIGDQERTVETLAIRPVPLATFDLEYDANWVGSRVYLSDSGGCWSDPGFDATADDFPYDRQLHALVHPDWWASSFETAAKAATA